VPFAIGDTFVWCPPGTGIDHLWILISDPAAHAGKCVLVNLTESSHGKLSYTLTVGQHRWIYKDSDVNFGDAFQTSIENLSAHVSLGSAIPHDKMDSLIVNEIILRAKTTRHSLQYFANCCPCSLKFKLPHYQRPGRGRPFDSDKLQL